MYNIITANIVFEINELYILIFEMYKMIAYSAPIALEMSNLMTFTLIFNIIDVAYNIMQFIIRFSKKITSIYIVTLTTENIVQYF